MTGIAISLTVSGISSVEEIASAFGAYFKKTVSIVDFSDLDSKSGEIAIAAGSGQSKRQNESANQKLIADQKSQIKELEESSMKSLVSIQVFHKQQQALFDEFVLLRQKYDQQKEASVNILWSQCATHHPDLKHIPKVVNNELFQETDERLGKYIVGEVLGEGQFATVKECWRDGSHSELALKIILKAKINTFTMMKRVSNEIFALSSLKYKHIVNMVDVIQTPSKLYIITEKGGADLFEFFDTHTEGVCEAWALSITANILKGLYFCHERQICHRDLKPENILVTFDTLSGTCTDLKLCDFGLSTQIKPKVPLTDFCGSPGFFAPEMVIQGGYYGDKADVWSIGAILLELILGHDQFCESWMCSYDFELLHDVDRFSDSINCSVKEVEDILSSFSPPIKDFIMQLVSIKSSERPRVRDIATHPWLEGSLDAMLKDSQEHKSEDPSSTVQSTTTPVHRRRELAIDTMSIQSPPYICSNDSTIVSPAIDSSFISPVASRIEAESPSMVLDRGVSHKVTLSNAHVSTKERRLYESGGSNQQSGTPQDSGNNSPGDGPSVVLHLPPVTPATPSITNAKKLLRRGEEIYNNVPTGSLDTPLTSPSPRDRDASGSGAGFGKLNCVPED